MRLIVHARARADLDEIFEFSRDNWDYAQAAFYVGQLTSRMNLIAEHPGIGQTYDSKDSRYLRSKVGRHFIYYRADLDVHIFRVLHERMQQDLHLP